MSTLRPDADAVTALSPPGAGAPRVVVTRPRHRADERMASLRARGVEPLLRPAIEITPPADPGPLHRAAEACASWAWVAFTSTAGVRAFAGALDEVGADLPPGPPPALAAVGPSTAAAVAERFGRSAVLVPDATYSAAGLLDAFLRRGGALEGRPVLLPLAEAASDELATGLREAGARVERVTAYRTVPPDPAEVESVRGALAGGDVRLLTFTSPSTAENFLELVGETALATPAAAIGPVTAEAARELGYRVVAVPERHTVEGLVAAVVAHLRGGSSASEAGGRPSERDGEGP